MADPNLEGFPVHFGKAKPPRDPRIRRIETAQTPPLPKEEPPPPTIVGKVSDDTISSMLHWYYENSQSEYFDDLLSYFAEQAMPPALSAETVQQVQNDDWNNILDEQYLAVLIDIAQHADPGILQNDTDRMHLRNLQDGLNLHGLLTGEKAYTFQTNLPKPLTDVTSYTPSSHTSPVRPEPASPAEEIPFRLSQQTQEMLMQEEEKRRKALPKEQQQENKPWFFDKTVREIMDDLKVQSNQQTFLAEVMPSISGGFQLTPEDMKKVYDSVCYLYEHQKNQVTDRSFLQIFSRVAQEMVMSKDITPVRIRTIPTK